MHVSRLIVIWLIIGIIVALSGVGMEKIKNSQEENFGNQIPPIDNSSPSKVEVATFSLGCFWSPDAKFGAISGVINTRVGYAGGKKPNPTYYSLGKHTETVQIRYNPEKISYENLLEIFWNSHDPTLSKVNTQYKSIIFYHGENQKTKALESKTKRETKINDNIVTEIRPFENFYLAEEYHQKYFLQSLNKPYNYYMDYYKKIYPDLKDLLESTAVTRANGYAAGYRHLNLAEELEELGLKKQERQELYESWKINEKTKTNVCPAYL